MEKTVQVRVVPKASRNELTVQSDGSFVARVTAPPEKGQANEAVRQLLAQHFDVAPSRVELLSGATSRSKRFRIRGG